ncbi:MAG: imidazole glycerol phosphate synthase subunit HisH [Spirochaetia bacterium]
MSTGVIDYDAGNLKSVETALTYLGADFLVSSDPDRLSKCDRLIFPGVGDANAAMGILRERGLDALIREFAGLGRRLLGICLGSQIVLESSEENGARCLGLVPGTARKFPGDAGFKVPHMGWNRVTPVAAQATAAGTDSAAGTAAGHPLFAGIPADASFYFVHSYYPDPADSRDIVATTDYIVPFASAISRGSIWAVQFHPEKSGRVGLRMLSNFLNAAPYAQGPYAEGEREA